jgi:hypothetical protein
MAPLNKKEIFDRIVSRAKANGLLKFSHAGIAVIELPPPPPTAEVVVVPVPAAPPAPPKADVIPPSL